MTALRAVAAAALVGLAWAGTGCGGAAPPPAAAHESIEPHWQDVVETTPELLIVLRPAALAQDKVYGPLLRRALDVLRKVSRVVEATRLFEVMQGAKEVVVGLRPSPQPGGYPAEAIIVIEGVPANVDPAKVVDAEGHPLWSPGPPGPVRELVLNRDPRNAFDASLFEMEGLTWLIAVGDARIRAREVFQHPLGRPELKVDPEALAMVRIDGPSLVQRIHALQPLGDLAALGRELQSFTATLPPGSDHDVRFTLTYSEEDAAAFSEVATRHAVQVIAQEKPEKLAWLGPATVDRPDKRVVVTLPLPAQLVDALLHAGTAPIDFGAATSALGPPR